MMWKNPKRRESVNGIPAGECGEFKVKSKPHEIDVLDVYTNIRLRQRISFSCMSDKEVIENAMKCINLFYFV